MNPGFYIVGIGTSAGGLEVLRQFFQHIPSDTGAAYVVVQHLSPDHKSLMDNLLKAYTNMPLEVIENEMRIKSDKIYLMPPAKSLHLEEGKFILTDKTSFNHEHQLIDTFLRSLAEYAGKRSIAVVLSGMGTDGSRGIRDVHHAGGLVMVQDPQTAKFEGMPFSSSATGLADYVAPLEELAEQLLAYLRGDVIKKGFEPVQNDQKPQFKEIINIVSAHSEINFSQYKEKTLYRQLEKAIGRHKDMTWEKFPEFLRNNHKEIKWLKSEFLLGVTNFFRDHEAFQTLKLRVIPKLISDQKKGGNIRVWVIGCSTGEEVYSIAMLLEEHLHEHKLSGTFSYKIFAGDVDQESINIASEGVYPNNAIEAIPESYLHKYFNVRDQYFSIIPRIRQKVVFAQQDITLHPPFSNIDLVSCRNMLIYFKPEIQHLAIQKMHFALKNKGFLFLGGSETLGTLENYFEQIDRKWRIFQKKSGVPKLRLSAAHLKGLEYTLPQKFQSSISTKGIPLQFQEKRLIHILLDRFCPPSVIVDTHFNVLYMAGDIEKYLHLPKMQVNYQLFNMLEKGVALQLRSALRKVENVGENYELKNIYFDGNRLADIKITAFQDADERARMLLIEFHALDKKAGQTEAHQISMNVQERELSEAYAIQSLENELQETRQELQATVEELESTNEELQASNEELMASNEELQGTNEELQSVNEELLILNGELQNKMTELAELNDDINNLLDSTEIGTVFLDREHCIRKFTSQINAIFPLRDSDVGRPITDINYPFSHPELIPAVTEIIMEGRGREYEVESKSGVYYLLRIMPFRNHLKEISGTLLQFINIDAKKRIELDLRASEARWRSIINGTKDFITIVDQKGKIVFINYVIPPLELEEVVGSNIYKYYQPETAALIKTKVNEVFEQEEGQSFTYSYQHPKLGEMHFLCTISPILGGNELLQVSMISRDITDIKEKEKELQRANTRFNQLLNAMPAVVAQFDMKLRFVFINDEYERVTGVTRTNLIGKSLDELDISESFIRKGMEAAEQVLKGKEEVSFDNQISDPTGHTRYFHHTFSPEFDPKGNLCGVIAVSNEITPVQHSTE